MPDDIVTRLSDAQAQCERCPNCCHCDLHQDAIDEILRLRAAMRIAAGKLSTLDPYTEWHPETIYKALLEDGNREARRG